VQEADDKERAVSGSDGSVDFHGIGCWRRSGPTMVVLRRGRVPSVRGILQVHCVQLFYNLSDPVMEDLLYEG